VKSLSERFWSKVDMRGPVHPVLRTRCWLWTGCISDGYGQIRGEGGATAKVRQAIRVSWELIVGPIPEDHEIDHLCEVKACVRPEHLEPVTGAENIRRYAAKRFKQCKHGGKALGVRCRACNCDRVAAYRTQRMKTALCMVFGCPRQRSSAWYCGKHLAILREQYYQRKAQATTSSKRSGSASMA
jgi:hypothetical protein